MSTVDLSNTKVQEGKEAFSWESFFSSFCARVFFLFLLALDGAWFCFLVCKIVLYTTLYMGFLGSSAALQKKLLQSWVSVKRSVICALALLVALFSPAFGIMIGCTYFLMYDKKGIEEVVPASIREQFKDLFSEHKSIDN